MKFSPVTLERFRKVQFQGLSSSGNVLGMGGSFQTGRFAVLGLLCQENQIVDARFQSFNCISVIAAADWVCETIQNQPLEAALKVTVEGILDALDGLPPSRHFCAHLVCDALKSALEQAQMKGLLQCGNSV